MGMRMRLVGVLLAVLLATSSAYADPLPFEVVRMLPETSQVLVFDRAHNTHVLLQPGAKFDDYVVVEVSGMSMTVEKQQERFVVYPKEAKFLALNLLPRDPKAPPAPPVIYGKSAPALAPAQVADAKPADLKTRDAKKTSDAKVQVAQGLGLALAVPTRATARGTTPPLTTIVAPAKK
jgi:hypothetical protein